jgi:hypothetical protein
MDKYKGTSFDCAGDDTIAVAESVRSDFRELITMLERQLANVGECDAQARSHILEAKAAAESGLKLSEMLLESIKTSESN